MESVNRFAARRRKGKVETWNVGNVLSNLLDCKFVAFAQRPVADSLSRLARAQVSPHPDKPQGRKDLIVKVGRGLDVSRAKRDVMEHVHRVRFVRPDAESSGRQPGSGVAARVACPLD